MPKEAFADSFQKLYERCQQYVVMAIILKANKVNLFVSSVLFVFWDHSPNFLDTPRSYCMTCTIHAVVTFLLCGYFTAF
jgi:hypothetical protein